MQHYYNHGDNVVLFVSGFSGFSPSGPCGLFQLHGNRVRPNVLVYRNTLSGFLRLFSRFRNRNFYFPVYDLMRARGSFKKVLSLRRRNDYGR